MKRYPWFVKGDLDGFFGLAVDNLVQVLVIVFLCRELCGFSNELLFARVLPGIAVSLIVGNFFYAFHARHVAKRDSNFTCTALPYGINTPSVFAYILFILAPVYARYKGMPGWGPEKAAVRRGTGGQRSGPCAPGCGGSRRTSARPVPRRSTGRRFPAAAGSGPRSDRC